MIKNKVLLTPIWYYFLPKQRQYETLEDEGICGIVTRGRAVAHLFAVGA